MEGNINSEIIGKGMLMGQSQVGKSSILRALKNDTCFISTQLTLKEYVNQKNQSEIIKLLIHDTPNPKEGQIQIRDSFYQHMCFAAIIYDVNDEMSFSNVQVYKNQILEKCKQNNQSHHSHQTNKLCCQNSIIMKTPTIILIGNKTDCLQNSGSKIKIPSLVTVTLKKSFSELQQNIILRLRAMLQQKAYSNSYRKDIILDILREEIECFCQDKVDLEEAKINNFYCSTKNNESIEQIFAQIANQFGDYTQNKEKQTNQKQSLFKKFSSCQIS